MIFVFSIYYHTPKATSQFRWSVIGHPSDLHKLSVSPNPITPLQSCNLSPQIACTQWSAARPTPQAAHSCHGFPWPRVSPHLYPPCPAAPAGSSRPPPARSIRFHPAGSRRARHGNRLLSNAAPLSTVITTVIPQSPKAMGDFNPAVINAQRESVSFREQAHKKLCLQCEQRLPHPCRIFETRQPVSSFILSQPTCYPCFPEVQGQEDSCCRSRLQDCDGSNHRSDSPQRRPLRLRIPDQGHCFSTRPDPDHE